MKARHEFDNDEAYRVYLKIYFAAMAMQGLISLNTEQSIEKDIELALKFTDALINGLNKQP